MYETQKPNQSNEFESMKALQIETLNEIKSLVSAVIVNGQAKSMLSTTHFNQEMLFSGYVY